MSLMGCPECQHEISSSAYMCPNCGFPTARHPACERIDTYLTALIGGFVGVLIAPFVLVLLMEPPSTPFRVMLPVGILAALSVTLWRLRRKEKKHWKAMNSPSAHRSHAAD